ncbi:ABC transporter ATP-binding protein [Halogranum rubrum]|uniref:ABC-type D-xylose/L-arabinose transporter n=1 Tax=Halogranum salarium B-1 TaxID=1210908 RepID=J3JE39_9EURY|nr:ABC transporter ATP-binding protein [Halogranum salarium]EJN58031.1 ABC transporter-like protein [Halogranum salarium B-1]
MARINVNTLRKEFGDGSDAVVAVEDVDFQIEDGEFLVLVGPSGCGKTTTLRCIAGLEDVTSGTLKFGDTDVTDLRARERDVAMVFQNYALYPHMDVRSNIGFGLKLSTKLTSAEIDRRVEETAAMLGISDLLGDKPKELSGGQQQRVALGRAIVREPEVFLMDEPLSNLDAKLRAQMRTELQELQHELGVTTVYVTHDQTEAMAMGDRIAVMNDGRLQQVGRPEEVYRSPTNEFVANFIGSPSINLFTAEVNGDTLVGPGGFSYTLENPSYVEGYDRIRAGIRPEDMRLVSEGGNNVDVTVVEPMGNENFLYLTMGDIDMTARVDSSMRPQAGETVQFAFDEDALYLFDAESGDAIKTKTDDVDVGVKEIQS